VYILTLTKEILINDELLQYMEKGQAKRSVWTKIEEMEVSL